MPTKTASFRHIFVAITALFSANAMTLVGGILLPILVARLLGADALGIFTTSSTLGLLVTTCIDWGYETALPLRIRQARSENQSDLFVADIHAIIADVQRVKMFLWIIVGAMCLLGWTIFAVVSQAVFFSQLVVACAIYLVWAILRSQMATYAASLRGLEEFRFIARIENIFSLGMYTACSLLLWLERDILLAILTFPLAEAAKILAYKAFLKRSFPDRNNLNAYSHFRQINSYRMILTSLREQVPFVAIQILSVVQSRAGIFALDFNAAPQAAIGYFGAGMRFVIALRTFAGAVFNVVLPSFGANNAGSNTQTVHQNKHSERHLLKKIFTLSGGISLLGSMGLFLFSEELVRLVYGPSFLVAAEVLRIIAPLFALQTLANVWEAYLLAHQEQDFVRRAFYISLGVFVLFWMLIGRTGGFMMTDYAVRAAWSVIALEVTLLSLFAFKGLWLLLFSKK